MDGGHRPGGNAVKLGLFFGSSSGMTEHVAETIKSALGADLSVYKNIGQSSPEDLAACDALILGIPTWDDGRLQSDWDYFLDKIDRVSLAGKKAAIFGLGDAYGYPETFQDAIGLLAQKLESRGCVIVGAWPVEGYEFNKSLAVRDGKFLGLALDVVNQDDQTAGRVAGWLAQVRAELSLPVSVAP